MRIVVDLSDYQAGLNIDAVAGAVDGVWAKAGDWSWVNSHGWPGDDVHDAVLNRFNQLGRPVGSYFFPRPGWTSPGTQINAWADHVPMATTVVPMLDLEVPGTLSGGSLQAWIDEALAITTQRFGHQPVLYWNAAFCNAYGLSRPSTPHTLMVAEYHRGYQTAAWANRAGWEDWAYSAYGGPGIPRGYSEGPRDAIWQWTSSAQIPGFSGLVDCSFIPDSVWPAITGGAVGGSDLTQEEHDMLTFLHAVFSDDNRWGALWNAAGQTANMANQMNNVHRWTDVDGPGWKFPDGTPITTLPQFLHNLFLLQGFRDDGHGHKLDHLVTATGEMTPVVTAHGGKLDHIVASGDATGPQVTNIQSMARTSGTNMANVVKVLEQHTTVLENILKAGAGGGGSIDYAQLARALVTELMGRFGKTPTPTPPAVPSPPSPPTPPMPPTPPTPPSPPNPGNLSSGQALMQDHPDVR